MIDYFDWIGILEEEEEDKFESSKRGYSLIIENKSKLK